MTAYDLTQLDPNSFAHLVNALAFRILGPGLSTFSAGADGGRDGYFAGEAPYPSDVDRWSGRWYLQSKFHAPHLSKDPQKWLLAQIDKEIAAFTEAGSERLWPDNWIVCTNIDPSGVPMTGAFDAACEAVRSARPELEGRFHIWGGSKLLAFLSQHMDIARQYAHFLTPGHVLSALYDTLVGEKLELDAIVSALVTRSFSDEQYTRLDQAGLNADQRPGVHALFVDLPCDPEGDRDEVMAMDGLLSASATTHRPSARLATSREYRTDPRRGSVWFVRGGPGQGKSTIAQFFCQLQRAALIATPGGPTVNAQVRDLAQAVIAAARDRELPLHVARIPIQIELKEFAQWYSRRTPDAYRGVLSYLAERISNAAEHSLSPEMLKRALAQRGWFIAFDGLDEVPEDVKSGVADEVCHFLNNIVTQLDADVLALCTSRPQGYAGQFDGLEAARLTLAPLPVEIALKCAEPVIALDRSPEEASKAISVLRDAMRSAAVRELMTSPLQAHIMAVIVRGGRQPPERRWALYHNFYEVMREREANRRLPDVALANLLREGVKVLRSVHARVGFELHASAETGGGARTSLPQEKLREIVQVAVSDFLGANRLDTVNVVMKAATLRLVLLSTPDNGQLIRFDIRPLQEFFAAEYIYENVTADELRPRLETIAGDAHWREVVHFLLSAFVENGRKTELAVAREKLRDIDAGDPAISERTLCQRLARGAILAARLLEDGVLEDDKRVRDAFDVCLEPLMSSFSVDNIFRIGQLRDESRRWIVDIACRRVLEHRPTTESFGALVIVAILLPKSDARVGPICKQLADAPPELHSALLLALRNGQYSGLQDSRLVGPQEWISVFYIQKSTSDTWHEVDANLLPPFRAQWRDSIAELSKTFTQEDRLTIEAGVALEAVVGRREDLDFGFCELSSLVIDEPSSRTTLRPLREALARAPQRGVVRVLGTILDAVTRDADGIRGLMLLSAKEVANLPMPANEWANQIISATADESVLSHLRSRRHISIRHAEATGRVFKDIRRMVRELPDLWRRLGPVSELPESVRVEAESEEALAFTEQPRLLAGSPGRWHEVFSALPDGGQDVRRAICECAADPTLQVRMWDMPAAGYRIPLETEAVLLVPLARGMVELAVGALGGGSWQLWRTHLPRPRDEPFAAAVERFVPSIDELSRVSSQSSFAPSVRAAALVLTLIHSNAALDVFIRHASLARELVKDCNPTPLLNGVLASALLSGRDVDPTLRELVSGLLDDSRERFAESAACEPLLAAWRERSRRPVTRARDGGTWR